MRGKTNGHKQIKSIRDLSPDVLNANKGTPRGQQMVEDSLRTYGAGRSILVDKKGGVIAGNKTLQSASDIDLPIRVVETDGKELVVVQRTDLDLKDAKTRQLGIADNRSSQVGLEWDAEILAQLKDEGVELSGMFTEKELAAILPQGESRDAEPQIDKAAELQQKWQVATGEIIQIGRHRLMCGDASNPERRAFVIDSQKSVLVSDPPYGINADTSWLSALHVQRRKPSNKSDLKLVGDDGSLDLSWAFAWPQWLMFGFPYIARSEPFTGLLVWDKRGDGGEGGLGNPVEVAASNAFNGYRLKRHVWAGFVREAGEKRQPHMTQKPTGIMVDAIELVKGDIFDPFVGSGTTLVAAENLNRTCYAMEISPDYCAVVLERMTTAFPHLKIEREAISRAA